MLIACWSTKGGSGTTVVASALALLVAQERPTSVLLVDLAGDVPAVLGLPEPAGPGVGDWLVAGADVGVDALARLEVDAGARLRLLPQGAVVPSSPSPAARADALVAALAAETRPVVVDCGAQPADAAAALVAGASHSLLVIRPCYLALRRALACRLRPSAVVLVSEPGRSLRRNDVEEVLGVPVRVEVAVDPAVFRAVDAGLLSTGVPRPLERVVRAAA